ncbi:hypothetical protein NC661_10115 [Aquibacillus koreensis]|uniref:Uncharacterized protein n=1 Tax=Aquibacillus koreensis TaxID=279446 RepID=A0A9X3WJ55_9BACI|nr:hypothetical protein [Aquibacillus koreensis]MCT2534233.1 hypothetical protein [Aquibacillus koreensis]MDC3420722.1 hypothetical protein [Aquibacillus koreensis]
MFSDQIGLKLEVVAKRALFIKKNDGFAGIISADYIVKEKGAFTVLCTALAPYYLNASDKQRKTLDEMIDRYKLLQDCDLETYFKTMEKATEELKMLLDDLGVQAPD